MSRLQVLDASIHLNLKIKRNVAEKAASQAEIAYACMFKKGYFSLFFLQKSCNKY